MRDVTRLRYDAIPARIFRLIQTTISTCEKALERIVLAKLGHAKARGDKDIFGLVLDNELLDGDTEILGCMPGSLDVSVREQQPKLLAAEAGDHVVLPRHTGTDSRKFAKHTIAAGMAKRVVDGLKMINVKHH